MTKRQPYTTGEWDKYNRMYFPLYAVHFNQLMAPHIAGVGNVTRVPEKVVQQCAFDAANFAYVGAMAGYDQ
jgi:hypothetical protein